MIEELRPFTTRRRERVKPKLAGFLGWLRSQRITGGRGIRVYETEAGASISVDKTARQFFIGAFNVTNLGQGRVQIGVGFVNGLVPVIDGSPLSERPELKIPKVSGPDPAYILLKVEVDKETERIKEDKEAVSIVAESKKPPMTDVIGYHPIAAIHNIAGTERIYQLAYFSYNHAYKNGKHFFVPA